MPHFVGHGMVLKLEKQICIKSCPYSFPGVKRFKYDAFLNKLLDIDDYRLSTSFRRTKILDTANDCEAVGVDDIYTINLRIASKELICNHGPEEIENMDTDAFSVGIWIQNRLERSASYGIYEINNFVRMNSDMYTSGGDGKNQICLKAKYETDWECLLSKYEGNVYLPNRWVYVGVAVKKIDNDLPNTYNITMVEMQFNPSAAGIADPEEIPNPKLEGFKVTTKLLTLTNELPSVTFNSHSYCHSYDGSNICKCFPPFKTPVTVTDKCTLKSTNPKLINCLESKTDIAGSACGLECCNICMEGFFMNYPEGDCEKNSCSVEGCKSCGKLMRNNKGFYFCKYCDKGYSRGNHRVFDICEDSEKNNSHYIENCKFHRMTSYGTKKCFKCFSNYILAFDESECIEIPSDDLEAYFGCRIYLDNTKAACGECLPGFVQNQTDNTLCFKVQT